VIHAIARPSPKQHLATWLSRGARIQHHHRDLALGLALYSARGGQNFGASCHSRVRSGGGPGTRLHLLGPDLDFDLRVGDEVAVPAGVLQRAAFRGDNDITVASFPVVQW